MNSFDFVVGPLVAIVIVGIAWLIRPYVTDSRTVYYYYAALYLKIAAAIAVGLIYTFYYDTGDTFTYYTLGSKHIYNAFIDSPAKAFSLIFTNFSYENHTYEYASKIYSYGDSASYFVVRLAGLFGILTANSYVGIAILFGSVCFTGVWAMYQSLYKIYPDHYRLLALAILFVPSVVFWSSGVLKDTITMGALGWLTWSVISLFLHNKKNVIVIMVGLVSAYIIYTVKIYILLCFVPCIVLWLIFTQFQKIRSFFVKAIVLPVMVIIGVISMYYSILLIGESSSRYSLELIQKTAEDTARWNYFVSLREGGAGYTLGNYDFTTMGIIRKFPSAVWITFFRPYLWEATNPLMILTALESLLFLLVTITVLLKSGIRSSVMTIVKEPLVLFFLGFAIFFGFAAGLTTYNFGSLSRYRIPLIPFYLVGCVLVYIKSKAHRSSRDISRSTTTISNSQ